MAVFEGGAVTVASPESLTRSPATPGGLWKISALIVLLVKAELGVKVGPEVIVNVPANAEVEKTRIATRAATRNHTLSKRIGVRTDDDYRICLILTSVIGPLNLRHDLGRTLPGKRWCTSRMTFDDVRKIGLKLPRAEESRYYRMPALKVDGEIFVVCTSHPSAEPNSVSVPVGFKRRAELIARDPAVFI